MPDDRTTVTELGTALGMLPFPDPRTAIAARPATLHVDDRVWSHLDAVCGSGRLSSEMSRSFANGRAFLEAPDALRGRPPMGIEWTGGRRPPGDEVAPIDLRIDHVYLVSCKYESDILANASPGRLFEGMLSPTAHWDRTDWYEATAPVELTDLYRACVWATGLEDLPDRHSECTRDQLQTLQRAVTGRSYPDAASCDAYRRLCRAGGRVVRRTLAAPPRGDRHRRRDHALAAAPDRQRPVLRARSRPAQRPTGAVPHRRPVGLAPPVRARRVLGGGGRGRPTEGRLVRRLPTPFRRHDRIGGRARGGPLEPWALRPAAGGQGLPRYAHVAAPWVRAARRRRGATTLAVPSYRMSASGGDDAPDSAGGSGEQWSGEQYQERFDRLAASGVDVHGEADFVAALGPTSVLDAGCGTGRVARELARRGIDVAGVDVDASMIATARRLAPDLDWYLGNVAALDLGRTFDVVVMAGNVPLFTPPANRRPLVAGCARHLAPGGALVGGFQVDRGYRLEDYDEDCRAAGLVGAGRWSTWAGDPFRGGDYAVSMHRLAQAEGRTGA